MPDKQKICLVTGSTGFLGTHLCYQLLDEGYDVIGANRNLPFPELEHVDYIFHCAAELFDKEKMFQSNVVYTDLLLQYTKNINYSAFVHVGSFTEFGTLRQSIREDDKVCPNERYGATKAAASILAKAFAMENGKPVVIARPFNIFGQGEAKRRFIPTILRCIKEDKQVNVYRGAHDFVYVKDVVHSLIRIAKSPIPGDEVNIGTGRMTTNEELLLTLQKVLGIEINYRNVNEFIRSYDSDKCLCDTNYSWSRYGIMQHYDIERGLRDYL